MKKRILAGVTCAMVVCSVGVAAPVIQLENGESVAGYTHSHLNGEAFNGFYIQSALDDKLILGLDYSNGWGSYKEIDIYGQYQFKNNARFILGNRQYKWGSHHDDRLLYGVAANTPLGEKTTGYASLLLNSFETDWKLGLTYDIARNVSLDLNYRIRDMDYGGSSDGVGLGVNLKF